MGYLKMDLTNLEENFHVSGICLRYENFLADLNFTADSSFEKRDEYPVECFHEKMGDILKNIGESKQKFPLLFSVCLDSGMSFLDCSYRYTFIVMEKALFKRTRHDYEIDKDTLHKCFSKKTDCIVLYVGMSIQA